MPSHSECAFEFAPRRTYVWANAHIRLRRREHEKGASKLPVKTAPWPTLDNHGSKKEGSRLSTNATLPTRKSLSLKIFAWLFALLPPPPQVRIDGTLPAHWRHSFWQTMPSLSSWLSVQNLSWRHSRHSFFVYSLQYPCRWCRRNLYSWCGNKDSLLIHIVLLYTLKFDNC